MNNIFSTELADELNDSKYLEGGIHENVKFEGASKFTSPNGNKGIEFKFSKNGKEFSHTEWEPRKFSDSDTTLQERTNKLVRRIAGNKTNDGLMNAFYTKDELKFMGQSFDEFIDWVVMKLSSVDTNELYRIKIIYNKNGYTSFPNYVVPPFIQKMSDSTVTVIPSDKDVFIAPIREDKEKEVEDKLPF